MDNITESLVSSLHANHGFSTCFANPGTTEMGMLTAMGSSGMQTILCLHENVATGAADGFFRVTQQPACTLLHLGPGLANGLSNLHNARRAGSRVLNLVGEISTTHKEQDPPLASDIESLARTVSGHVRVLKPASRVAQVLDDMMRCVNGDGDSRIATLVVPHDCNWTHSLPCRGTTAVATPPLPTPPVFPPPSSRIEALVFPDGYFAAAHTTALRALYEEHGVDLLCKNNFACIQRGGDMMPPVGRIEYFPSAAQSQLAAYKTVLFVNTTRPVAMFGYESQAEHVVPDELYNHVQITGTVEDVLAALRAHIPLCKRVVGVVPPVAVSTADKLAAAIVRNQPTDCIVVDESITFGKSYWEQSRASKHPFRHLGLTGGSIGMGPSLSVGAAIGARETGGQHVLNLQGDGSAAYSLPAFWTQSRYGLPVVTIILANNKYKILQLEQRLQKLPVGSASVKECTDLSTNPLDWEALMTGFNIQSSVATNAEELEEQLTIAFSSLERPYCIILATS